MDGVELEKKIDEGVVAMLTTPVSLPIDAKLELLVGHLADYMASMLSAVEKLEAAPKHVRLKSEIGFVREIVGNMWERHGLLNEYVKEIAEWTRKNRGVDGRHEGHIQV